MTALRGLFVTALVAVLGIALFGGAAKAATGLNQQISFQGKLVTTAGTNLPDGTYNLEFKIYQDGTGCVTTGTAPCGGTLKWTETRLVSATQGVTVTAGTFQVNLGAVNTALASQVDFNQDTLWLSMNVGGTATTPVWDGEMVPFIRLTAVPYALNSAKLGGLSAAQLVQLQTGTPGTAQTGNVNVTGSLIAGGALSVGGQNVISSAGKLQNPALDSSTVYSNITGVGTITAGTWNAGVIAPNYGGTGNSSYAAGDLLYATGATTLSKLAIGGSGTCVKSTGTALNYGTCATSLQSAYDGGATIAQTPGTGVTISSASAPTADQLTIDNTASAGVTTAGVNGANIKYKGGSAAIEAAGMRIDYAPGTTTGGTWSGMRIVANPTGAATGVTQYGIKIEGPTSTDDGTVNETGIYIGTGWDIGLNIASGAIQLASQADPTDTVATGQLRLYAQQIAGRMLPKWVGPSGVDTPVQASFGFNRIATLNPNGGAAPAITGYGMTPATVGTGSNQALASTSLLTSVRRTRFTSASGVGQTNAVAGTYSGTTMAWRGNAAGRGGFFFTIRFNLAQLQTGNRGFIGLADSVAAPTNVDPTTSTTYGKLGLGFNANTGNLKWVNNVSGTAPTTTDLTGFPVNTTDLYELIIFSAPNGSGITYRVKNLSTSTAATPVVTADTTATTNIPTNTTFLAPMLWITNNTQNTAVAIETAGWYLESDN